MVAVVGLAFIGRQLLSLMIAVLYETCQWSPVLSPRPFYQDQDQDPVVQDQD